MEVASSYILKKSPEIIASVGPIAIVCSLGESVFPLQETDNRSLHCQSLRISNAEDAAVHKTVF